MAVQNFDRQHNFHCSSRARSSLREGHVGEHVGFGIIEDGEELGHLRPDLVGDGPPLCACRFGCLLAEGCGDEGRDDAAALSAGMREHVPHEVNAAALPWGRQPLGEGSLQALMGIGDDELDPAQASAGSSALPPRFAAASTRR